MVCDVLAQEAGLTVTATTHGALPAAPDRVRWVRFDAERDSPERLLEHCAASWLVNCVGIVKPFIDESDSASVVRAVAINSVFPRHLAAAAARSDRRVIEIATDGVFSGRDGPYDEGAAHDPTDVYGKTKSLGERAQNNVVSLRCSIVGPEQRVPAVSLLSRTLASAPGSTLTGFAAQRWNGVSTLHFARLCAGVIRGAAHVSGAQHIVPGDTVTKADLLAEMLKAFGRGDVSLERVPGPSAADRTLSTHRPEVNASLWRAAGYPQPPTIAAMLDELAERERRAQR